MNVELLRRGAKRRGASYSATGLSEGLVYVSQCVTDFREITRVVSAPASFHHYTVLSRGLIFGFQNGSRNNRISAERSDRLGPCFRTLLENFFGIFENTD